MGLRVDYYPELSFLGTGNPYRIAEKAANRQALQVDECATKSTNWYSTHGFSVHCIGGGMALNVSPAIRRLFQEGKCHPRNNYPPIQSEYLMTKSKVTAMLIAFLSVTGSAQELFHGTAVWLARNPIEIVVGADSKQGSIGIRMDTSVIDCKIKWSNGRFFVVVGFAGMSSIKNGKATNYMTADLAYRACDTRAPIDSLAEIFDSLCYDDLLWLYTTQWERGSKPGRTTVIFFGWDSKPTYSIVMYGRVEGRSDTLARTFEHCVNGRNTVSRPFGEPEAVEAMWNYYKESEKIIYDNGTIMTDVETIVQKAIDVKSEFVGKPITVFRITQYGIECNESPCCE